MVIVKDTSSAGKWYVYHRSLNSGEHLKLNTTDVVSTDSNYEIGKTTASSTEFSIDTGSEIDASGNTYIAYFFAHNDDDGGFGEPGDQDIIKCGSYTGNNSTTGPIIDLGFEPQWLLIRHTANDGNSWHIFDSIRGVVTGGSDAFLAPNTNGDEQTTADKIEFNASGFQLKRADGDVNANGNKYIYMAIRRGGMQTPTAASDVFALGTRGASTPGFTSNFPVDMAIRRYTSATGYPEIVSRLTGARSLQPSENFTEGNDSSSVFDHMTGYYTSSSADSSHYSYMWKRARGYFDVCCYSGTGSARTVAHNLGAVPEMMWVKARNATQKWAVYHSAMGNTKYVRLNDSTDAITSSTRWNDTTPTASVFTVGTDSQVNNSSYNYIAYLFATVAGVSKVGSYTGTGSDIDIDCGFTSGARFVLIKNINAAEHWFVFDSVRGITTSTSDPFLYLSLTNAQGTNTEIDIDPLDSGFKVAGGGTQINGNGDTHIFYAIA